MYTAPPHGVTARRSIDVAVGILMGLRRCSEEAAFQEIARVVHETGMSLGDTARALISLAHADGGHTPHHAEATRIWGAVLDFPTSAGRE